MALKKKLVLAWVDNTGIEPTGRYRDRFKYHQEFRSIPEAKVACFGDDSPAMRERIEGHVAAESKNHDWMGFFCLDFTNDILKTAKSMALVEAAAPLLPNPSHPSQSQAR